MRIIVLSRWAWRPRRSPQALRKRSTSSPVRNSRGRSWTLVRRGGGSVPFTVVGAPLPVAVLALRFIGLVVWLRDVLGALDHEHRPGESARIERRAVAGIGEAPVLRQALADDLLR